MGHVCEVDGCRSSSLCNKNKRKFYTFPLNEARCRQWIRATGRTDLEGKDTKTLHRNLRICDLHFEPSDHFRRKLTRYAVPSLNLPHQENTPNKRTKYTQTDFGFLSGNCGTERNINDAEATVPEGSSGCRETWRCDVCCGYIVGFRYACVECANFDLCGACEARAQHAHHYVLRVPASKLHSDVQAVITMIREELFKEDFIEEGSIKIEIKKEDFEQEDPLEEAAEPLQGVGSQDIPDEENEDSGAVKYLGLGEDGGRPVFEVPLSHQFAVPQVLSLGPKILPDEPPVLSLQTAMLSHQPHVLSYQPAILLHQPEILSDQPAILPDQPAILPDQPAILPDQPLVLSNQPKVKYKVPKALSHQPQMLSNLPSMLSHPPKVLSHQSAVLQVLSHQPKVLSHQSAVLQVLSHQPKVLSHQPAVPPVLSHESQVPHAESHLKRPLMFEEPTTAGEESKPARKKRKI